MNTCARVKVKLIGAAMRRVVPIRRNAAYWAVMPDPNVFAGYGGCELFR